MTQISRRQFLKLSGAGASRQFCPFDVPTYVGAAIAANRKANKCIFCRDRVANDSPPSCVRPCPSAALQLGDRDKVVAQGNEP